MRLYPPEAWSEDRARWRRAGVPDAIEFRRKWQIALDLLDQALEWGLQPKTVLADAAYGEESELRDGLAERELEYIVGINSTHLVWPPGVQPTAPPRMHRPGRPATRWQDGAHQPLQIGALVESIPRTRYRKVTWRQRSRGPLSSQFLFYRVHPAERHTKGRPPEVEHWLICEWREAEFGPRFYLSNLPAWLSWRALVRRLKLRLRVERDYQEMKEELGLDHFEGRTWRGFHHHATLCAVAHGFLALRRALFPPEKGALDSADGLPTSAAGSDRSHRLLPDVHPGGQRALAADHRLAVSDPASPQICLGSTKGLQAAS